MHFSENKLKQVFSDVFDTDIHTVNETTSMDTVEAWDSHKHLILVLALEEAFNVTLTEEETLEILNYILTKIVLEEHGVHFH